MCDLRSLSGVAVHLHHSTRTIQVQGSHIMPDASRAALWFVNNVILVRFRDQAKAKKFAIKTCNNAFKRDTITGNIADKINNKSNNTCHSCKSIFNTKSKPSRCENCAKYFHKTSCLKDHMKACHRRNSDNSLDSSSTTSLSATVAPPVSPTISSSSAPVSPQPSFSGLRTTLTFVPAITSSISAPGSANSLISSLATANETRVSQASSVPAPTSQATLKNAGKKKHKTSFPSSEAETKIDFLQTELNAAQARIVQLDASIQDKDRRVSVLMARLKVFEDAHNKDVFEKYFPAENKQSPLGNTPTSCSTSSPSQQTCSQPPRCCCSCSHPAPPPPTCCHNRCHSQSQQDMQSRTCSNNFPNQSDLKNTTIKEIANKLNITCNNTEELKTLIKDNLKHNPTQIPIDKLDVATTAEEPQQSKSMETNDSVLNASIASIEEFISENPESQPSQQELNFHLTNQLL